MVDWSKVPVPNNRPLVIYNFINQEAYNLKPYKGTPQSSVYLLENDEISAFNFSLSGKHPWVTCATNLTAGFLMGTRKGTIHHKIGEKLESYPGHGQARLKM